MKKKVQRYFCYTIMFILSGCATNQIEVNKKTYQHAIALQRDGSAFPLVTPQPQNPYKIEMHVEDIINSLGDQDEVLIFVHGGMVSIKDAVQSVKNEYISHSYWDDFSWNTKQTYPIFVNWESGLMEAYLDHLYRIRQGEERPWLGSSTALFYLAADVGRALTRLPIVLGQQAFSENMWKRETPIGVQPDDGSSHSVRLKPVQTGEQCINSNYQKVNGLDACVQHDIEFEGLDNPLIRMTIAGIPGMVRILTTPALDTFGKSAWDNMLRRTQTVFNSPHEHDEDPLPGGLKVLMEGIKKADEERKNDLKKPFNITLLGHSMGAIIINEIIRRYPDLNYKQITYLAAACTIKDFQDTVIPYMKVNTETQFANVTLHPYGDRHETYSLLILPQGSLLDWLDKFVSLPKTRMNYMMGKWDNLIKVANDLDLPMDSHGIPISQRIKIRGFGYTKDFPQTHGAFNDLDSRTKENAAGERYQFWMEEYWDL